MTRILGLIVAMCLATPLAAQQLIGQYTAYISNDDLYNSSGARLSEPWQVLRQDRANYHRFGIRQPGDEYDPWFGDIDNRAAMERMVMNGRMDPVARRDLVNGGAVVQVFIYGRNGVGTYVDVTVYR
jgi:hypothetical protein